MPAAQTMAAALDQRLTEKAAAFDQVREPDRDAAVRFFKALTQWDTLLDKAKEGHLDDLLRAVGYDVDLVKAQARTAGSWSNLQNWVPDGISTAPQAVSMIMLLVGTSPLSRAWTNFVLSGVTLAGTPIVGTYYIQPMLETQRLTRQVTSVNYGKAALPGPKYHAMTTERKATKSLVRRAQAQPATVTQQELATRASLLQTSAAGYVHANAGLLQRRTLNMPESLARCFRALGFMLAGWNNFTVMLRDPNTRVPVAFIAQFVLNALTWAIHWHFAGPTRDQRIRNEQLKVDFSAEGPRLAQELVARQTGATAPEHVTTDMINAVDDQAIEALRGMLKDRKKVQLEDVKKLYQADQHKIVESMTALLNPGVRGRAQVTVPEVKEYVMEYLQKPAAERTDRGLALHARIDPRRQALSPVDRERLTSMMEELNRVREDVERLDDRTEWINISSMGRKQLLDAVMQDAPTHISSAQIWQYLFKGVNSSDDLVRVAHMLAADIRTDWRRFMPDFQYKLGKAVQVFGAGSSTFPFVSNSLISIIEASGTKVSLAWKIPLSVGALGVYFLGERYSGELVNAVIAMREERMEQHPYGRSRSWSRRGSDSWMVLKNSALVPVAVVQDTGRWIGSSRAHRVIEEARRLVPTLPALSV
jgi:hypothetical protein